ncbi:hypothetical protein IOD16_27935 [Saccharothrix sp. 6-C]|uniref:hypothetical protein n=1 Tax=Saccharothrix sp. 6-C TaxID=2781735 RepID=UPI001917480E|nr:hypothetical protein [Saccharothrix sp. 6-C]QQQ74926.1 hypothetical protein IOD16_27935 [Saccharothrix sp. 6-C]
MRGLITPQRLAIGAVCLASLVVCCGLAYWQWDRFSQAGGTFQNLGYVFQWPLFGLFPAFMVWRIRRLDARRRAEAADEAAPEPVAAPSRPVVTVEPVRAPVRDDEDEELAAYNRMLAELNARDQR